MPIPFSIFPSHLFKVLPLPRKSDVRSYEVLHLSGNFNQFQYHSSNPEDLTFQNATLSQEISALNPNMSVGYVSCTVPAARHLCRSLGFVLLPSFLELQHKPSCFKNPLRLNIQNWSERGMFVGTLAWKCGSHHSPVPFCTAQLPKVLRTWCVFLAI